MLTADRTEQALIDAITNYNKEISDFMHMHEDYASSFHVDFVTKRLPASIIKSLLSIADRKETDPNASNPELHKLSFNTGLTEINIFDHSGLLKSNDPADLDRLDECEIIYQSGPPADIYIIPDPDLFRGRMLSRMFPVNGDREYMREQIYNHTEPVAESPGNDELYRIIMGDPNLEKLRNVKVKICGAGEVGSWAAILMTMLGMENISFYEQQDEVLQEKHAGKMPYSYRDIGESKSQLLMRKIHQMNPLTNLEYSGELGEGLNIQELGAKLYREKLHQKLESDFADTDIIVLALDNYRIMADVHYIAHKLGKPLILTTDIGKGSLCQIFRYDQGAALLQNRVTPEDLILAQDIRDGIAEPNAKSTAVLSMLGKLRVVTQYDTNTLEAFLSTNSNGHLGYLPQDPTAAFMSAAMTATAIGELLNGTIQGDTFFLDPRNVMHQGKVQGALSGLAKTNLTEKIGLIRHLLSQKFANDKETIEA